MRRMKKNLANGKYRIKVRIGVRKKQVPKQVSDFTECTEFKNGFTRLSDEPFFQRR